MQVTLARLMGEKKSSGFQWHKQFKEGCENMEDERSGHPRSYRTNENVAKVWNLVHLSIRDMTAT
jgi:hypothetical protein